MAWQQEGLSVAGRSWVLKPSLMISRLGAIQPVPRLLQFGLMICLAAHSRQYSQKTEHFTSSQSWRPTPRWHVPKLHVRQVSICVSSAS